MVLVMCKKQTTKKWECLTKAEKQSKDKEKPNVDESADPSDGLMTMLKKIYSEGDDEMKRTINKAWSESSREENTRRRRRHDGLLNCTHCFSTAGPSQRHT
ncbi:Calcyclin-binding protein [Larimichthys crocea]|uniref:Uncharacterized protein n=1 Tax=Larimichthys crocea TaxID=215358 RepID=A0ACD3QTM0_LARCR|nr:Calcyclin-binding protein [Larimichthys crocea]